MLKEIFQIDDIVYNVMETIYNTIPYLSPLALCSHVPVHLYAHSD